MPTPETGGRGDPSGGGIRIFINYRRDDTPGQAGRLYDALTGHFGDESIFMDVDTIDFGADFIEAIEKAVGSCQILIALIGRQWLAAVDEHGRRRIDNPEDVVSRELQAALERGIPVIPALVGGTEMPSSDVLPENLKPLARRHALEMGDGARWRFDVERLIKFLERFAATGVAGQPESRPEPESVQRPQAAGRPPRSEDAREASHRDWSVSKRVVAALAALALVLAAIGAVLLTRGSHHQTASTRAPGSAVAGHMRGSGEFPDAIEAELLLAHVPEGIRKTCRRADTVAAGVFLRSVSCSQGPKGEVTYSRAHSGDALRAYFVHQTNSAGLDYPTTASCAKQRFAADEWLRDGLQTHVEKRSHRSEGRVLCYEDSRMAWLAWTDTPTKIFASASRPRSGRPVLYEWWRTKAGPEKELGTTMGMSGKLSSYPDAIEQELLLDHVPAPIRKTCKRSTTFDQHVFLRAVVCDQVPGDGTVQYAYAHSGTALRSYSDDRISEWGLSFATSGTCARSGEAAGTWARSDAIVHVERRVHNADGRVLCSHRSGRTFLEWTDASTGIYGSASRPIAARAALYDWWRKEAGPGPLEAQFMGMGEANPSMSGARPSSGMSTSGMTTTGR